MNTEDNHMHTLEVDNASYVSDNVYATWCKKVKSLTRLDSLDGDRSNQANPQSVCCLDELAAWYRAGYTPEHAANRIFERMFDTSNEV